MDSGTRFFVSFSSRDLKYVREIMAALKGQELDDMPESMVRFTAKVCKLIGKLYIPPIEAHSNKEPTQKKRREGDSNPRS